MPVEVRGRPTKGSYGRGVLDADRDPLVRPGDRARRGRSLRDPEAPPGSGRPPRRGGAGREGDRRGPAEAGRRSRARRRAEPPDRRRPRWAGSGRSLRRRVRARLAALGARDSRWTTSVCWGSAVLGAAGCSQASRPRATGSRATIPSRNDDGAAHLWFRGMSAQEAWEATVDSVNAAGEDWADDLHLNSMPDLDDRPYESSADPVCSFCGKPERTVEKLVAGPGIYICDECVTLCVEIIDAERAGRARL